MHPIYRNYGTTKLLLAIHPEILSLVSVLVQKTPRSQTLAVAVVEEKSSEEWFAMNIILKHEISHSLRS